MEIKEIKSQERKQKSIINAKIIGTTLNSSIQIHGEAASQMLQAYKGIRVDSLGNDLQHKGRSLKRISIYKTGNNPSQVKNVIKSQAGFSGELIKEARDNKDAILKGKTYRTRTTDGLGQTNNPIFDHVKVNEAGNIIDGSGSQMKIYKTGTSKKLGNTYDVIDKLAKNEKWKKYDCPVDIPSDQYDGAVEYARKKTAECRNQADACRQKGNTDLASQYDSMADQYDSAGKKVRKSNMTTADAIEARINPEKFISKELRKDMHKAGKDGALGAAIISGAFSIIQNTYEVIVSGKDIKEAGKDIVSTTATSSTYAYTTEFIGTGIKAGLHSSSNELARRIGRTNAATTILTTTIDLGKTIKSYACGESLK